MKLFGYEKRFGVRFHDGELSCFRYQTQERIPESAATHLISYLWIFGFLYVWGRQIVPDFVDPNDPNAFYAYVDRIRRENRAAHKIRINWMRLAIVAFVCFFWVCVTALVLHFN